MQTGTEVPRPGHIIRTRSPVWLKHTARVEEGTDKAHTGLGGLDCQATKLALVEDG